MPEVTDYGRRSDQPMQGEYGTAPAETGYAEPRPGYDPGSFDQPVRDEAPVDGTGTVLTDRDTDLDDRDTGLDDRDTGLDDRDTGLDDSDTGLDDSDSDSDLDDSATELDDSDLDDDTDLESDVDDGTAVDSADADDVTGDPGLDGTVVEPTAIDPVEARNPDTAGTPELVEDAGAMLIRWQEVQTGFVDDPSGSLRTADELVQEVMEQVQQRFQAERTAMEQQWSRGEDVTTEDLRLALQRDRTFFNRLLKA